MLLFAFPMIMLLAAFAQYLVAKLLKIRLLSVNIGIGPAFETIRVGETTWRFKPLMFMASIHPKWTSTQREFQKGEDAQPEAEWIQEAEECFSSLWWRALLLAWAPVIAWLGAGLLLIELTGNWDIPAQVLKDCLSALSFKDPGWSVVNAFKVPFVQGLVYLIWFSVLVSFIPHIASPVYFSITLAIWKSKAIIPSYPMQVPLVFTIAGFYLWAALIYAVFF